MSNAWINHVRNFRRQNRHLTSYRQLLQQARQSYNGGEPPVQRQGGEPPVAPVRRQGGAPPEVQRQGGDPAAPSTAKSLQSMLQSLRGGGITGMESRSSLASSATRVGGRSRRNRRKTRRSRR